METLKDIAPFLPSHLQQGDYVALTFFLSTIAMLAGAVFFFFQFMIVPKRWKNSVLIMGLVMFIASLNYFYMRDYWVETQISPTEFRYFDWLLTVPLLCVEFYLIIRPYGAKRGKMIRVIFFAIWMLFWGYVGEALDREHSFTHGLISTVGAIGMMYEIGMGIPLVLQQANKNIREGYIAMFAFILIFWNIYPLAYMTIPGNLLSGIWDPSIIEVLYNLGDIINKVVFSAVFFLLIIASSDEYKREIYGDQRLVPPEVKERNGIAYSSQN